MTRNGDACIDVRVASKGRRDFPMQIVKGATRPTKITVGNNVMDWGDECGARARAHSHREKWTIYRWAGHYGGPLNSRHVEITSISHTTATLATYPPHTYGGATRDNASRPGGASCNLAKRSVRPALPHPQGYTQPGHSSRAGYPRNRALESTIYSESKIDAANGPVLALRLSVLDSYFAALPNVARPSRGGLGGLDCRWRPSQLLPSDYSRRSRSRIFFMRPTYPTISLSRICS